MVSPRAPSRIEADYAKPEGRILAQFSGRDVATRLSATTWAIRHFFNGPKPRLRHFFARFNAFPLSAFVGGVFNGDLPLSLHPSAAPSNCNALSHQQPEVAQRTPGHASHQPSSNAVRVSPRCVIHGNKSRQRMDASFLQSSFAHAVGEKR